MTLRYFSIILVFISSFIVTSLAYGNVTYIPAAEIFMTGSTPDIRFDVEWAISDSGITAVVGPRFKSGSNNFEWAFYMTGIGWGLLHTGAYQVGLDCGAVDFSIFTGTCQLTWTWWSETVGELGFSWVEYISSIGILSWSISTFVGEKNISGIYLPLRPAYLTVNLDNSLTKHNHTLVISWSLWYGDSDNWSIEAKPRKDSFNPPPTIGSTGGTFSGVDLSIADTYDLIITDPNGSTTTSEIHILPNSLSVSLETDPYFLKTYCSAYSTPSICPDGTTVNFTTLTQSGISMVADWQSYYDFRLRGRDKYGNAISTGSVSIEYTTTVKAIQIDSVGGFTPSTDWDAVIHSGGMIDMFDGTSSLDTPMLGQDVYYGIASIAPTNTTDNIIKLNKVDYTDGNGVITTITGLDTTTLLEFTPWFTVTTTNPVADIQTSEDHAFSVNVTQNSPTPITPKIYTLITIGSGLLWAFRDFSSTMGEECQAYPQDILLYTGNCDWPLMPSVLKVASAVSFTITGSYAPMTRYPTQEEVISENAVQYTVWLTEVLYHAGWDSHGTSILRDPRIKIIWTNNALWEYGDLFLGWNGKAKFFDTLRKKITLLSRNRDTYSTVDYLVATGAHTLTGWSFDTKRSIIVKWGDVTISDNIAWNPDAPLVIIALADMNWSGGIVTISPNVTDIHATIITDRHIFSSGGNQLYVHGSLISSNTLGDTVARICPYYITTPCGIVEAALYDLENLRKDFTWLPANRSASPQAAGYPNTSLIVEQDPRIISNPPPGL
jgi:hypothetical protein